MVNAVENCYWDYCPSEVLLLIFKYLDTKSLLNCLSVNKRWFSLVSSIADNIGWEELVRLGFTDKGAAFRKKSDLDFQNIIINKCLWQNVNIAESVKKHCFFFNDVLNMHVYKGELIVITSNNVSLYDLDGQFAERRISAPYADFDENDYMISSLQRCDYLRILNLCPKQDPDSDWDDIHSQAFTVPLYKVYDDNCYVTTTDRCLFALKWMDEIWDWKLLARHYGHGVIVDINVYQDHVYAMLNWGGLLLVDVPGLRFKQEFSFDIPKYSNPVLFQKYGAVVAVPKESPVKFTLQDSKHWVFECPGLTSMLEHGDMLFLGFEDGRVELYEPQRMEGPTPAPIRSWTSKDYVCTGFDVNPPAVIKMEVRETELSHDLFIATNVNVHYVKLVYPESTTRFLLDYFSS